MAWSTPMTAVSNATFTAAQFNASVRDNLLEGAPAKATATGQLFVATGVNAIAARTPTRQTNATAQTTATVATYGDLATVGPAVTVTTGVSALVFISSAVGNATAGGGGLMSFAVSGATTIAASDDRGLRSISGIAGETWRFGITHHQISLNAGSNTFTAKYTTPTGGTCTFQQRELGVLPL
jgi:hypothetical protein